MATSERPPPDHSDDRDFEGSEHREGARRLVERLLRRAVEKGVEKITETPDDLRQYVENLKLPREIAAVLLTQIDETKNGLYRAVAKEMRDFLEHTDLAEGFVRALTTLSFEIKTEIRFIPNDQKVDLDPSGKLPKPDVKATVRIRDVAEKGREKDREKDGREVKDGAAPPVAKEVKEGGEPE